MLQRKMRSQINAHYTPYVTVMPVVLPLKKQGRPVLFGKKLGNKVQVYLKKVKEGGGGMSAQIAVAAARGIVLSCNKSWLEEFRGSA